MRPVSTFFNIQLSNSRATAFQIFYCFYAVVPFATTMQEEQKERSISSAKDSKKQENTLDFCHKIKYITSIN